MNNVGLAAKLAAALTTCLPAQVRISTRGPVIVIEKLAGYSPSGSVIFDLDEVRSSGRDDAPGVEAAVTALLHAVQDTTAEATAEPWPGVRKMPVPRVLIDGDLLRASYVDEAGLAVVELTPIDLASLPDRLTIDDYLDAVSAAMADHPDWREGQTFFNVLRMMRPDLATSLLGVSGSDADPFNSDKRLPAFLDWLEASW